MVTMNPVVAWFAPKVIGYGWSPATWESWVCTFALMAAIVVAAQWWQRRRHP